MKYPFLQLSQSNNGFAEELKSAAARVIDSGRYVAGEEVKKLERCLAGICGVKHCVTAGNGLDSLYLILEAMLRLGKLPEGARVGVPANSFIASALPVSLLRLNLVMLDVERSTRNLDLKKLAAAADPGIDALIAVHLYGAPCGSAEDYDALRAKGIVVIEDNAQALGAYLEDAQGKRIFTGSLGDAAAISFYPTKNVGALGDAGAVLTDNDELSACVRSLANYGSNRRYEHTEIGINSRMDEIQAAFLNIKLTHLEKINSERNTAAAAYLRHITNSAVELPSPPSGMHHVWHQFTVLVSDRDRFRQYLENKGVGTGIHYPIPIHRQPCYETQFSHISLPVSERLCSETVSLPIANISAGDAREISDIINEYKP